MSRGRAGPHPPASIFENPPLLVSDATNRVVGLAALPLHSIHEECNGKSAENSCFRDRNRVVFINSCNQRHSASLRRLFAVKAQWCAAARGFERYRIFRQSIRQRTVVLSQGLPYLVGSPTECWPIPRNR
jgi:hypothetical protein